MLYALSAAFVFGLGVQFARKGLNYADYKIGTPIIIVSAALFFWLISPWFLPPPAWSWVSFGIFAAIGLMMPLISSRLANASTQILGPTISTTVASVSPLFGMAFGVLVFGESIDVGGGFGGLLIVIGIMMLSWRPARGGSVQWPMWVLVLPVGAALIRALAQGFTKLGYEDMPSAFMAGVIGYSVSAIISLGVHAWRGGEWPAFHRRPGLLWFVGTGFVNGIGIMFLYIALRQGTLVVVAPMVATSPVFTLILTIAIFRQEHIDWRKLLGVALVVPGVVLIASRAA